MKDDKISKRAQERIDAASSETIDEKAEEIVEMVKPEYVKTYEELKAKVTKRQNENGRLCPEMSGMPIIKEEPAGTDLSGKPIMAQVIKTHMVQCQFDLCGIWDSGRDCCGKQVDKDIVRFTGINYASDSDALRADVSDEEYAELCQIADEYDEEYAELCQIADEYEDSVNGGRGWHGDSSS